MSQHSPEDIIELARRQIAQRDERERDERLAAEARWRYLFVGLLLAGLLGIALIPELPLNMRMYSVVHGVCAQLHNELLGGVQLPLCARNTGIYAGFLLTVIYLLLLGRGRAAGLPPWPISALLALLVLVMAFDGFNSLLLDIGAPNFYQPFNALRTLSGLGAGIALGVFLPLMLNNALRADARRDQRVLNNGFELAGAVLLSLLVQLIIYGDLSWGYWPVAIISFLGITGILFAVTTLVLALLMGYEDSVTRWRQLARPASYALLFTALLLAGTSSLRFWLEAQGLMDKPLF
jgi:uncharacterized membrane protein